MTSAAHPLTILAKNGLHVSPVHRLGRIWAAFFEPKCSKNGSRGCLWGALGMAGWGPWAPRDAPEHKLEKIKKKSLFWTPKWMQVWYIFHQNRGVNDGYEIVEENNAKLYDFLKKTRPEYMQLRNITQVKNLNFEEMQCKANVRFTRGKQWF